MTENENIKKITLTNGRTMEVDFSKANGHLLMKCRELSGGVATIIYMISEIATFDGEKIPVPEILNWDAFTIIEIEEAWANSKK
jgi:hypothetical protein